MTKNYRKNKSKNFQFTYKQHYIGRQFLSLFTDKNGMVEVVFKNKKSALKSPNDKIFCTFKCWNEMIEQVITSSENKFMEQIKEIESTGHITDHHIIHEYFRLWNIKGFVSSDEFELPTFQLSSSSGDLNHKERDSLEKMGCYYSNEDGLMPDDFVRSLFMQKAICLDPTRERHINNKWDIVSSSHIEFVLPDFFNFTPDIEDLPTRIIPITPHKILIENNHNLVINESNSEDLNEMIISMCKNFYVRKPLSGDK